MVIHDANAQRTLQRLLANGPLTAMPKRPDDQVLLARLAASQFELDRAYSEGEVNDQLSDWLDTFCAPFGIDHVTMRRLMVDSRLLMRDKAGSTYRVNPEAAEELDAEPAQVLAQARAEREARKRAAGGRAA